MRNAPNTMQGLIDELSMWAGIDKDYLMSCLVDNSHKEFNNLAVVAIKAVQSLQEEKQKNLDKIQKLIVDKKHKEVEQLKVKIAENETKKLKEIQDKLTKF